MGLLLDRRSWRDIFVGFFPARASLANFSFFFFISNAVGIFFWMLLVLNE